MDLIRYRLFFGLLNFFVDAFYLATLTVLTETVCSIPRPASGNQFKRALGDVAFAFVDRLC